MHNLLPKDIDWADTTHSLDPSLLSVSDIVPSESDAAELS